MDPDLESLLKHAQDSREWRDGDSLARPGQLTPNVVLMGRIKSYDQRPTFLAALTQAKGA